MIITLIREGVFLFAISSPGLRRVLTLAGKLSLTQNEHKKQEQTLLPDCGVGLRSKLRNLAILLQSKLKYIIYGIYSVNSCGSNNRHSFQR